MEVVSTRSMADIELKSNSVIPQDLSVFEKEIVSLTMQSENNQKLKFCDLLTLAEKISNTVNIRMGLKPRAKKEELIFIQTIEADCNKFPELTESEVLKFLEMGIDGRFNPDKDFYFTSSLFVKWGRAYIEKVKTPTMEKHAQLVHQIEAKKIELTMDQRIENASEIANGYVELKIKDPEYKINCGAALYQNLENLGLFSIPLEEKKTIFSNCVKLNTKLREEDVREICQNVAYNKFIDHLIANDLELNKIGQIVKSSQE